ncbi:MAG: primosomal protein N' [Anaerolineae bacterium]|jgi:primosomal protein N' (replication factor Y)
MFVRVVVLSPVHSAEGEEPLFDYHLPEKLVGEVEVGSLVTVPFGSRRLYAIAVDLPTQPAVTKTRPAGSLVDPEPVLSPEQIELARWMSRETLAPLYECLLLMLPPGVVGLTDTKLEIAGEMPSDLLLGSVQRRLLDLLQRRGPLRGGQLDRALPRSDWRSAADRLVRRGVLVRTPILAPPRARPRRVTTVRLVAGADTETGLKGLRSSAYSQILALLNGEGGGPVKVKRIYAETGCTRYHLNKLEERELVAFDKEEVWRDPLEGRVFFPTEPPPLTPDQQEAWDAIRAVLRSQDLGPQTFLLHGVTGSGKTEIYLRAVAEVLDQGRRAVVLVPEISLTPQTVTRFAGRFPGRVTVVHSQLSDGERYDVWRRARAGLVDVVVGPRSALFTPLSPLGLIVLDEEHDASYKQQSRPAYHTREAAIQLARLTGATVVLGSATPSLESYLRARREEFRLLELNRRILSHTRRLADLQAIYRVPDTHYRILRDGPPHVQYLDLPLVKLVDMRAELRAGNRSIFSRALAQALDEALGKGEQAILFLNRRGTATFVLCRDCGYVARCPDCDVPLTYHGPRASLICHHCSHREPPTKRCPRCGGTRIRHFGLGTQGLEEAVRERWPGARLLRWDRDTARSSEAHWTILQRFSEGQADVLVGTQMIAKGLDLPLVTVVGVISADTALNLPDFRAAERTFQLLEQVAGRAGRGLRGGRVVLQTYHPNHYAIRAVEQHDYEGFAREELAFRRQLDYPPYVRVARLLYRHRSRQRAEAAAEDMAEQLRDALSRTGLPPTDLIGPAPAFFARIRGRYRWHIILRHADPPAFLRSVGIPPDWRVDVDPENVL